MLVLSNKIKKARKVSIVARNVAPTLIQTNNPTAQVIGHELSMALAPAKIYDITAYDFLTKVPNSSGVQNAIDYKTNTNYDGILQNAMYTLVLNKTDGTKKIIFSNSADQIDQSILAKLDYSCNIRAFKAATDTKTLENSFPFQNTLPSYYLNDLQSGWGATNVGCSFSSSSTYVLVDLTFNTLPDGVDSISLLPHTTAYDKGGYGVIPLNATMVQKGIEYKAKSKQFLTDSIAIPYAYPVYAGVQTTKPVSVTVGTTWTDSSKPYTVDLTNAQQLINESSGLAFKTIILTGLKASKWFTNGGSIDVYCYDVKGNAVNYPYDGVSWFSADPMGDTYFQNATVIPTDGSTVSGTSNNETELDLYISSSMDQILITVPGNAASAKLSVTSQNSGSA